VHEQPIEIHDEGVWALVRRRERVGEEDLESGFVEVLEDNQEISEARDGVPPLAQDSRRRLRTCCAGIEPRGWWVPLRPGPGVVSCALPLPCNVIIQWSLMSTQDELLVRLMVSETIPHPYASCEPDV
jgi:hypothetical protein